MGDVTHVDTLRILGGGGVATTGRLMGIEGVTVRTHHVASVRGHVYIKFP